MLIENILIGSLVQRHVAVMLCLLILRVLQISERSLVCHTIVRLNRAELVVTCKRLIVVMTLVEGTKRLWTMNLCLIVLAKSSLVTSSTFH